MQQLQQVSWIPEHRKIAEDLGGAYQGLVRYEKSHLGLMRFRDELYVIKPTSSGKIAPGQIEMLSLLVQRAPELAPKHRLFHSAALVYAHGETTLDQIPNFWDDQTLSRVALLVQKENDVLLELPALAKGFEWRRAPFHFLAFCWRMLTVWGTKLVREEYLTCRQVLRVFFKVLPSIRTVQITDQNIIAEHLVVDGDRIYPIDWSPVFRPRDYPIARFLAWNWLRSPEPIEYFIQRAKGYGILPLFAFCVIRIGWDILDHEVINTHAQKKLSQLWHAFDDRLLP